jgi:hypothetical protein
VDSLSLDLSSAATTDVHTARLIDDGILSITLPASGIRVVRLDVTSDDGTHEWLLSSSVDPATPYAADLDLMPPAGAGVVRSYWITGAPGRLDIWWTTVARP